MFIKRTIYTLILFLVGITSYPKDLGYLSLCVRPGIRFPLASTAQYFTVGGGGGITAEYTLPKAPFLGLRLTADTMVLPIVTADTMVITTLYGGPGFNLELPNRFCLSAYSGIGYYYCRVPADPEVRGGNLAVAAGLGGDVFTAPLFFLRLVRRL